MRKLFLFLMATLFATSLWATDPTLPANATPTGTLDIIAGDNVINTTFSATKNRKKYIVYDLGNEIRNQAVKAGKANWVAAPANDGGSSVSSITFADGVTDDEKYGFTTSSLYKWGIHSSRYCGFRVTNCTEAAVCTKSNGSKDGKTLQLQVFVKNNDNWNFVEAIGATTYNNSKAYVLTSSALDGTKEYIILLTSAASSGSDAYEIRFASSTLCDNPNASIIDDGVGFVGDAVDLEFSSDNTNAADTAVTLDAAAATDGVDYEFVAEGFKPLKAGEFEITISQAKDATHCAVEESVTLTISQKTPVTTFTIPASSSARVGQEVNLSITDLDAAATKIGWILAGDTVSKTADYIFTPSAAGTYVFTAYAQNGFNNGVSVEKTCTITVAISNDATLSALAVTGKTLDPTFNAGVFSYSVGEIGVYEALAITYTVNDAPYATAVLKNKITTDGKDTVVVTAENGEDFNEYIINYTRAAATELVSISGDATWNWTLAGDVQSEALSETTLPKQTDEINFADVLTNNDASFNAAALAGKVQWYNRYESSSRYTQGNYWKFNTTVSGKLVITYGGTNTKSRVLKLNGTQVGTFNSKDQKDTDPINISAGDVLIEAYEGENLSMARIYKMVFTKDTGTALDNTADEAKAVKFIENGQVVIFKDGKYYNVLGMQIR